MDTYVVRIYRREEKKPHRLVGVVEEVEVGGKKTFHTMDELACILTRQSAEIKVGKREEQGEKEWEKNENGTQERRQVERLKLRLPVKVNGTNSMGRAFSEETTLEDLSPVGAFLSLRNPVEREARLNLLIDPARSDLKVKGRVVRWDDGSERKGVGVLFEKNVES